MNKVIKTCSFVMPGEFEKQKSVWIVWPHNKKDWPGYFNTIPGTIANIISKLSISQKVKLIIQIFLILQAQNFIIIFLKDINFLETTMEIWIV